MWFYAETRKLLQHEEGEFVWPMVVEERLTATARNLLEAKEQKEKWYYKTGPMQLRQVKNGSAT